MPNTQTHPQMAPIVVFIYNRPDHLRRTLLSLNACIGFDQSPVIVFGDGPKREDQLASVEAARAVAHDLLGARADYRFSPVNKGLARSIIDGVNAVVAEHGRAIVVEDDLALAPGFLTFMNSALERYADDENVYQVSGYAFNVPELAASHHAIMLPLTSTWGWGTWHRAWLQFDHEAKGWEQLKDDPSLRTRFNLGGANDYATMLLRQMNGASDSWGVRWYWTVFKKNGMVVFPPHSLVRNTGMDGSGSHGRGFFRSYGVTPQIVPMVGLELPDASLDNRSVQAACRAIWRQNGGRIGQLVDVVKAIWVSRR
jgi:Glycosyl transferase family 2